MKKTVSIKQRLIASVLVLAMLVTSFIGTTFAWFTDSVTSAGNTIQSGNLSVDLLHKVEDDWVSLKTQPDHKVFNYDKWEPGYTQLETLKIVNLGSLALQYRLSIEVADGTAVDGKNGEKLADVIEVFVIDSESTESGYEDIKSNDKWSYKGTLSEVLKNPSTFVGGQLLPTGKVLDGTEADSVAVGNKTFKIALHMSTSAGNEYQGLSVGDIYVNLIATQWGYESDSFGNDYDGETGFPTFKGDYTASADVEVNSDNTVKTEVSFGTNDGEVSAKVPEGVLLENGVNNVTLTVSSLDKSNSNIEVSENQVMNSVDVHVSGIAAGNTKPVVVKVKELLAPGLNMGNYLLYHVENGATVAMTYVASESELDAHNEFAYDPATGDVTMALCSFSEIALVADTVNAWEGKFDYSWYTNAVAPVEGSDEPDYKIANADQLAAFGAIVGGMNGQTRDSFSGKIIKLLANINLGDKDNANENLIFHPIGYYYNATENDGKPYSTVKSFEGTFDGNGNTISNFYQNTWEIKGDYDGKYYKDAMGLFGYVVGGKVCNLTVDNFSSDGEFTPTGVIAAYAVNSTFENIAITNCNPRVYNTGNGGIVGIGGNSDDPDTYKLTFTNITIDNTNKITALWGSWDVACGGLVGMFRGAGHAYMTNCHVAAQIDVYNDVCGNYQYYWYRYSGMMIGTNKNMITDANGYTVPETEKFHAEACTVHFGDWNNYYYCELVDNSIASYTHDHQFSRLTEVKAVNGTTITYLDGTTGTVPTSGRANYVVVNGEASTENATCYHFKDGNVWKHADAGTETVDVDGDGVKETVLKEDRQHYYLPFNQLFTGYGWGVKHIPVYNGENYAFDGITILDRTEANSVNKFEGKVTELANDKEYKLSDIFNLVNTEVKLVPAALTVTVTNLDENGNVSATFARNNENWENGTLILTGTGRVQITIQDYYFCTPTTITVNVTDREAEEKFEVIFNNGDFLHRVGNSGTVALDKLFKAKDGVTVGTISVTVEALNGTGVSGAYTANTTDWTKGTIQFAGTGVVKVTITDNDYCIATTLYLEVVNATNITSATGTTSGGDMVLLCDVNTSAYVNYWNCTLWGNGFTYSLNGAPTAYNSKQGHGILITKNATLDNLVVVGDVYNSYGAYTNQDYYNAAVDVLGDTIIQNCYISGCAAPVSTRANATITNTTLYGGTVGNLIIKSGTVTLEDVTTVNYDDGRPLVGMGIVIHSDATEYAKLVLNGTLTQYNFMSESKVPTDTYAQKIHETMFGTFCSKYHFGTSPNRYVNSGIVSLTALFNAEDITDNVNTGYVGTAVTVNGVNGYVYTQPNTSGSVNNGYDKENDPHVATTQGVVAPNYSFDYTNKNYQAKQDGSNDYCYEENGKVNISMDDGDTFNWDTAILTATKAGQTLSYTVSMNGTDYTGKSIAFDTAGDYTVTYTYTDDNNFVIDENGNITTYSKTYTKTVSITVAVVEAATKHAEFTFGSSNTASTTVTVGNNTYVMPNVSGTSSTIGSTTVDGKTIYYPIVEIVMSDGKTSHTSGWYAYFPVFSGAVTITDYKDNGTGDPETFGSNTTTMPSGLSIVGDPAQLFKYQSSSTAGTSPVVKNNILVYSSPSISAKRSEYNTVIQYSYQDNAGTTYYYYIGYHAPAQSYSSICVTPDTLVTLADGTQKRIDQITYNEEILVWNFYTGRYDVAPVSLLVNHGDAEYEVIKLTFDDGTTFNIVGCHDLFEVSANEFIDINSDNVASLVGKSFLKNNSEGFKEIVLIGYEIITETNGSYTILSNKYYNAILNGMLSISPSYLAENLYEAFEVGEDMTYDKEKMEADIEKYGLYTYDEFSDYVTYEQFVAWNIANMKIVVGKGYTTYEDIVYMLLEVALPNA